MASSPTDRTVRFFVPGRIEVLGKHTDYAGGRSLLAAVDRGLTVTARAAAPAGAAATPVVRVIDRSSGETVALPVGPGDGDDDPSGAPVWAVYPRAVVRRVARDFPGLVGDCRIDVRSDLPSAAGLSSSSAFVVAVFLALDGLFGISGSPAYRSAIPTREALAGYLGAVERGSPFPGLGAGSQDHDPRAPSAPGDREAQAGVGTRGGSEDHVAMLCAEAGALVRYAFEPVRREGDAPMPDGWVFAVGSSGVRAPKAGAARDRYNRLSDEAARAAQLWRSATGEGHRHLGAILAAPDGLDRLHDVLWCGARRDERDRLRRRVRHFAAESGELVPEASAALAGDDLERFGAVVDRSQALAEELLGNQVPETISLARTARELGAAAASSFGAGFGGSVWALVPGPEGAAAFLRAWRERYRQEFPDRVDAVFFTTSAAAAARPLHPEPRPLRPETPGTGTLTEP